MKCGFGTFIHSKPAGKKNKGKDLPYMQPVGNIIPNKGKAYGSGNVYSENRGYPEKYKQLFNFICLITGLLKKLWYRIRKTTGKIIGKMKIC